VVETNQFTEATDQENCTIESIDEKTIQVTFTLYHTYNLLKLLIKKEDDAYRITIKEYKKHRVNHHCELYAVYGEDKRKQKLLLGHIGGDDLSHIGETITYPQAQEPVAAEAPAKPATPRAPPAVPHIAGKHVAAVITTFNGLSYTRKCVESIRSLRTSHRISIIVSDNCSTDGTQEWCQREGIPCHTLFGRRPVAAGINLGLVKAWELYPDYILVMNNDVTLSPDYLDKLVDHYESKRAEGCLFITGYVKNMTYQTEVAQVNLLGRTEDMGDFMDTGDFSCFLITPETLRRAGLFDESYAPRYVEDNDYLHAIYAAGGKAFRTGQTWFLHDWGTIFKVQPEERPTHIPTFRRNMEYYRDKWGDFPRGAERHSVIRDITAGHPCKGGEKKHREVKTWLRDQTAIIQMGHIGDVIDTLPVAKEIHEAGEEVVWLANQRFRPLLESVGYIDEVKTFPDDKNTHDTYFGRRFQEALKHAEDEKFRRTVIAQITPKLTEEFYKSAYPKNRFTYMVCLGRMPKSLRPDMPIVPYEIKRTSKTLIGLIMTSYGLPVNWSSQGQVDVVLKRVSRELGAEYVNLVLERYQGETQAREIGKGIAINQLSGAISSLDLLLTVDTGAYYPGLVTKTPIIHILPKPRFTNDPKAPPKYTAEGQGFSEFCEVVDYWYDGSLQDLDDIVIERLSKGTDLRTIKRGYAGTGRAWMTP